MVQVPRTLQFVTRGLDLTSYLEIGISLKLQIPAKSICPMITISLRWEFIECTLQRKVLLRWEGGGGLGRLQEFLIKEGRASKL